MATQDERLLSDQLCPPSPPPVFPRRPRELVPRRDAVLRDFDAPLFAVERFAVVLFFAGDLRAVDERLAPAPEDFAAVERLAVDLRAPVERFALLARAGFDALPELVEVDAEPSIDHLPDITRCAASATASAMIEPNLVALETTLLAARSAVSAASRPASRIFLRAAGLALIAAAAAARPAASISLLIAALASLSTVLSLEPEREDEPERDDDEFEREELLRADLAISNSLRWRKDTSGPFRFPNDVQSAKSPRLNM
jgi:hypothetical protein